MKIKFNYIALYSKVCEFDTYLANESVSNAETSNTLLSFIRNTDFI